MKNNRILVFDFIELFIVFIIQFNLFKLSYALLKLYIYNQYSLKAVLSWEMFSSFMVNYYGFLTFLLLCFLFKFRGILIIILVSIVALLDYYNWLMFQIQYTQLRLVILFLSSFFGISILIILKLLFFKLKKVLLQLGPKEY